MRTQQGTVFQSLRAIKGFLDEHADKLASVIATGAYKRLDDAIASLDAHAADQTGSYIEGQSLTQRQRNLRTILRRDHMAPVARIARADLPHTSQFRPLRMPRGRITPEKPATAGGSTAQVAAGYVARGCQRAGAACLRVVVSPSSTRSPTPNFRRAK
jgi:hypothetical protein